ncbi:MAG TPA: hypothetical protein VHW43_12265, partial [Puia sp.]|nr:hypothetical protein [Puia sp.]
FSSPLLNSSDKAPILRSSRFIFSSLSDFIALKSAASMASANSSLRALARSASQAIVGLDTAECGHNKDEHTKVGRFDIFFINVGFTNKLRLFDYLIGKHPLWLEDSAVRFLHRIDPLLRCGVYGDASRTLWRSGAVGAASAYNQTVTVYRQNIIHLSLQQPIFALVGQTIFVIFSSNMKNNLLSSPLFHKPLSIIAVKNLLYVVIFLDVITWAIWRWWSQPYAVWNANTLVILVVTTAILYGSIKCVTIGMKWARIVLLVLLLLELIAYIWFCRVLWQTVILVAVLILLQIILQTLALYFLFTRESTVWFNRIQEKAENEPDISRP